MWLQVELISLIVVFVEEDDGLGGEVVDAYDGSGLDVGRATSLMWTLYL